MVNTLTYKRDYNGSSAVALCPGTKRVLGGGAFVGGGDIYASTPISLGNMSGIERAGGGWRVYVNWNLFSGDLDFVSVYAICADV